MSERQAQLVTESSTAKQRPVRKLSADAKVEKDNKGDKVVSVEQTSKTSKAVGHARNNKVRQQTLLQAWRRLLVNTAGGDPVRKQSKPHVQLSRGEFATSDPTLLHHPTNDKEEALKEEGLQNAS